MSHKERIDVLFHQMADELFDFILKSEDAFPEKWVPATFIKEQLDLVKNAYPQGNKTDNRTGWFFATLARHLQDQNRVSFKKVGSRSFYQTK
ncbi:MULTISPECIES: hypothetical protein [Shewanella]|uniref:hypothetical protein n=1 Tax=Shewanella algae TaxID=38313 RepID=UPI001AACC851|nr:hypothetical protein [Shewanella algae]QTE89144.1 hypothetical protein JKK33_11950 [Shewanella algae]